MEWRRNETEIISPSYVKCSANAASGAAPAGDVGWICLLCYALWWTQSPHSWSLSKLLVYTGLLTTTWTSASTTAAITSQARGTPPPRRKTGLSTFYNSCSGVIVMMQLHLTGPVSVRKLTKTEKWKLRRQSRLHRSSHSGISHRNNIVG